MVKDAAAYAIEAHGAQRYGDQPYSAHLAAVADILTEWGAEPAIVAAGWLHDVIEDTHVSFPDLLLAFGPRVAHIVWAVTGEGDTRRAKVAAVMRKVAAFPDAALVKLADRIANVEAAENPSHHLDRYRREAPYFAAHIRPLVPVSAWMRLETALS